jgi:hypothetical protein
MRDQKQDVFLCKSGGDFWSPTVGIDVLTLVKHALEGLCQK